MNTVRCFVCAAGCLFLLITLPCGLRVTAQETDDANARPNNNSTSSLPDSDSLPGIRFGRTYDSDWQFGLQINANRNSSGIKTFFPIPRNWPEQEVEIVGETKSASVGKLSRKEPTAWTEQVNFSIKKMAAGQQAQAMLHIRIKKRMILPPSETSIFSIPKSVRGKLRTFLKPSPFIESRDKRIREIADNLRDPTLKAWDQVEKNYRWVRETVEYKFDPVIQTCLTALDEKQGDCEELSSLFIAICRCQGIPARAVWIPDHTYPEFYLEDIEGNGHWFPCQAAGTYAFGSMPETRPILQKGDRFKNPKAGLPGEPKEVRYIAPFLSARPGSDLAIQFIRRPMVLERGVKPVDSPDGDHE